jgi:hypothetical protein
MKKIRLMVFILFLCALILPFNSIVNAQENNEAESEGNSSTCVPLDVIFIIDQSGSMSGSDGGIVTDPYNQRKYAVDAMIDWFGENIVDTCSNIRHQVGVISFGSVGRVDIPLTEIKPETFEEYLESAKRLQEKTQADNMFYTNPEAGFELAKKLFAESNISTGGSRKKVIIFLTDGVINYDPEIRQGKGIKDDSTDLAKYINENFPFDPTLLKREQCLAFLNAAYAEKPEATPAEKTAECMAYEPTDDAYKNSTYIHMILMNFGSAWPTSVREIFQSITDSHSGSVMDFFDTGEKTNAIPANFRKVLESMTGIPSSVRDCGAIAVNPYLERATFTFYKYSPDFKVKIRYTDQDTGKIYTASDGTADGGFEIPEEGGYYAYGTNERYVINHPKPGLYYVESDKCSNGGVSVFYQEAQINPGGYTLPFKTIPQYDLEPYYDVSDPFYLTYEMRDSAGNVYQNESDPFGVTVIVTVIDPNGNSIDYPMKWDKTIDQFISEKPLSVQFNGTYRVNIVGTVKVHPSEAEQVSETFSEVFDVEKVLFSHNNLEFQVDEVTPFEISVSKPVDGRVLGQIHGSIIDGWPLPVVPIQIKAQVTLRDGAPLKDPVDKILANPDQSIKAWIEFPDGTKSEQIYLKLDQTQSATFTGEIPNIDKTVPLVLKVEVQNNWSSDYRPDKRVQSINFSRSDILPIYKTGFYYLLLGLLIAAIILAITSSLVISRNRISGELVISQNGIETFSRNLSINMKASLFPLRYSIPKKELMMNPETNLVSFSASYLPKEKDMDGAIMPRKIKVVGKTTENDYLNFELVENDNPQNYCTNSSNEMQFKN